MATIIVENDGPIIVNTNYWESEHATAGYAYLTINAGCYRLLMPPGQDQLIQEITTTGVTAVVISRGKWTDQGNRDALEIMFEDGTKSPIALHMSLESVDRLPDQSTDAGWKGQFAIYTSDIGAPVWECRNVYYRTTKKIPVMKPAPGRPQR